MTNASQRIRQDAPASMYFTQIINMADDEMDPYQFRLYGHYIRRAGDHGTCFEAVRTTAKACKMSITKVIKTRQWLSDNGWITCSDGNGNGTVNVRICDRMPENVARYTRQTDPYMDRLHGRSDPNMDQLPSPSDPNMDQLPSPSDPYMDQTDPYLDQSDPNMEPKKNLIRRTTKNNPIRVEGGEGIPETQPALTWFDGAPVAIDKSKRPTMTSKASSRQAFTPQWEKRLRSCRVDLRKFHGGQVHKGEGVTPIEVWCEYFAADSLNDITAEQIERSVRDDQVPQFREAIIAWVSRGYNPKNVGGILEWMNPNNRRSNGNGHGQTQQRPGTTWVAHQPQGAISLAELSRRPVPIEYADIDF